METITSPCAVLLSRIDLPIIFYQHRIYCLYLDPAGRFVSVQRPSTLDIHGEPVLLHGELPVGSMVRVHAIDGYLRTVQVISVKRVNPFGAAA